MSNQLENTREQARQPEWWIRERTLVKIRFAGAFSDSR